jgi:hypothetical protein
VLDGWEVRLYVENPTLCNNDWRSKDERELDEPSREMQHWNWLSWVIYLSQLRDTVDKVLESCVITLSTHIWVVYFMIQTLVLKERWISICEVNGVSCFKHTLQSHNTTVFLVFVPTYERCRMGLPPMHTCLMKRSDHKTPTNAPTQKEAKHSFTCYQPFHFNNILRQCSTRISLVFQAESTY